MKESNAKKGFLWGTGAIIGLLILVWVLGLLLQPSSATLQAIHVASSGAAATH